MKDMELSVGEVARRSGVRVSTVHFYEAKGLIRARRTDGNQRRYLRGVLRRIAVIRVAQRAGIPLSLTKEHLESIPEDRPITAADWRQLTVGWRAEIDRRMESLMQLRHQMDRCIGCGCLSLGDCPLRNPEDRLASEGSGPRLLVGSDDPALENFG